MKFSTLLFCLLLVGTIGCEDDDLQYVPPTFDTPLEELNHKAPKTQHGANTFGCLINGEVWLAKGRDAFTPKLRTIYYEEYDGVNVEALRYGDGYHRLSVPYAGLNKLSISAAYIPPTDDRYFSGRFGETRQGEWYIDTLKRYHLEITRYERAPDYFVSGEFFFTLYKPGSSDTLKITEGRFDSPYTQF